MYVLLQAFALGALGGIVPGAVLTILLVSTLQGGLKNGLKAFFWALFSEVVIAGALLMVAAQLNISQDTFIAIGFVGGTVLLYFAWKVFQLRTVSVDQGPALFTPLKIFLLSATNAPLYIFWTTICFPLIWQLASIWSLPIAAVSYFIAFEIGWAVTTFIMLMIFMFSRRTLTDEHIMRRVYICVALLLAGFGLNILVQSVQHFL